jgi:uncharacterized RDD family membrane protein YckC
MENGAHSVTEQTNQQVFPPLIKRFQSLIIDQVFIIICIFIIGQFLSDTEDNGALRGLLFFGLFFFYEPVSIAFGCSLGNYLTGIRVRKFGAEEERINILYSYLRFIVKLLLGIISFFTVTTNKQKRAIHDLAAGSVMTFAKKIKS